MHTKINKTELETNIEKLLFKYCETINIVDRKIYLFHSKEEYCFRYNEEKDKVEARRPFDTDFESIYFYITEEKLNKLYLEMKTTLTENN